MGRLQGNRTIVTGAGSGIGRAVLQRFIAEGARVVAVVRNPSQVEGLEADGVRVVVGDAATFDTAEQAVRVALAEFGGLDTYIANAGLWDFHKRLERQSPAEIGKAAAEILGVNLMGPLYGARAAAAELRKSRGSIIVTGSNACFLAGGGGTIYTASKFALRGLVLQLAHEFAPDVRVNGVAPGATDTGLSGPAALNQDIKQLNEDRSRVAAMASAVPLGRVSLPADHAALYVMLAAGSESGYVTGAMLRSDGGLTIAV
jgi:NAD(P)-dependent dehydrogenase (short-subunit alcohol dehydrogenase family)